MASGHERGHSRLRQLLIHLRENMVFERIKCWPHRGTNQLNHPGAGQDVHCVRCKRSVGTYPVERGSFCDLRSPRAPTGGPLLEPERPGRVTAEGANPFRKEMRDRSSYAHNRRC